MSHIKNFKTNLLLKFRICQKLLILPFLFSCISVFLSSSPTIGATSDAAISWGLFTSAGYIVPYTYLGNPISDHETSSDPTNGGAAVPPAATDLASASPGAPPGTEDTPTYGYYDGGTAYDPLDPSTMEDDYLFFRLRITGDPSQGGGFSSYHWNVLLDIDDDGYKEYWVDLQGSFQSGGTKEDRVQLLYNNDNTQEVSDPDAARVEQFEARYQDDLTTYPNNHTRSIAIGDGSGDYWIDIQIPMTAFNDDNGNQVVYPSSPVAFVYSTSASNTNPLQKDFMMDLDFLTLNDPITFGDVVTLDGEPILDFVDTSLEEVSFYTVGDNIYTYVKYPAGNTGTTTNESITVTVTNPSTGDDEQLTLYESGPNTGLFTNNGGASKPVSLDAANGWVPYVTPSSTTLSETWTLAFLGGTTWSVTGSVSGLQTATVTAGTAYTSDNGEVGFTLNQISPTIGDTVTFTTYPADALPSVTDDGIYNNSDDIPGTPGTLEVASGDTIQFSFTTPATDTYTTQTNIVGAGIPFIEFTRATGLPTSNFQLTTNPATSDQIYVTVTHPLSNTNPLVAESYSVSLTGNDSETITITETGPNTGIFRNTTGLQTQVDDGTPTPNLWEDIDEGTVTATYTFGGTPYSTTTQLFYVDGAGRVYFTNVSGTEDVELYAVGQSVYIKVEDKNNTGSSSVQVTVTSPTSGDSETVVLYETSSGSGIFTNGSRSDLVTTSGSKIITSASSTFQTDPQVFAGGIFTILDGPDAGDYIIESVDSETQITLTTPLGSTGTGIKFINELITATYNGSTAADDSILELSHDETLTVSYTDTVAANGSDDGDTNASNDIKTDTATYNAPPIVINEVFFYPDSSASYQTEYFMIYNSSAAGSAAIDIYNYEVTDGDSFSYFFPDDPENPGGATEFLLNPGEKVYVFLYAEDLSYHDGFDGVDTYYLYTDGGGFPADQFGDPGNPTPADQADQLLLYDSSAVIQDYVGWSYVAAPSVDFLGDDSPAVTQAIWQDDSFLDVLGNPSPITAGKAIGRISDGFDTDQPSDWTYPVDTSPLWNPVLRPILTPVVIASFDAFDNFGRVILQWKTGYENGTVGFYLYRKANDQFMYELVNKRLIPALITDPQGGTYKFYDREADPGRTYSYLLEEIVTTGERIEYGPFEVSAVERMPGAEFFEDFSRKVRGASHASRKRGETRNRLKRDSEKFSSNRLSSHKRKYYNSQASQPDALQISILDTGLYYISAKEIGEQFNLRENHVWKLIKKSYINLKNEGKSIPYFKDETNSGIYFYGREYNDIFTRENIYWLTLQSGMEMESEAVKSIHGQVSDQSFSKTIHIEEDSWPALAQPWDNTEDYWIWDFAFSGVPELSQMTFDFELKAVASASQNAFLTINFVGGSVEGGGVDHLAEVLLNDSRIGTCTWEGIDLFSCELPFRQGLLNEGENVLTIDGILSGNSGFSLFYVDSFDVQYQRYYEAVGNLLHFQGDENRSVTVSGFDGGMIYLLDVSNPDEPTLLQNGRKKRALSGSWLSFIPANSTSHYFAVSESAIYQVDAIEPHNFKGLKNRHNRAQYLVITPAELSDSAQQLADYRARQGYSTKVVHLEDILAEFNHGLYSPYAIKEFLAYAYNEWRTPPEYVVLIGDATYDYKDIMQYGGNLLPTIFVSTPHGLFASDNYLVDVDNDGVPDMAVGRLPVLSDEEFMAIFNKIKNYEYNSGGSNDKVLLLADQTDGDVNFSYDSDRLSMFIPSDYSLEKIYLSDYSLGTARQKLFDELDEGAAFVNYFGHAGIDQITQQGLLLSDDIDALNTSGTSPVITAMTCSIGQFTFPFLDTLAELLLLQPDGGATAIWSSSSLSESSEARILDNFFYLALFRDGETILGDAINNAHLNYYLKGNSPYHILIYNLLGDPALRVR